MQSLSSARRAYRIPVVAVRGGPADLIFVNESAGPVARYVFNEFLFFKVF